MPTKMLLYSINEFVEFYFKLHLVKFNHYSNMLTKMVENI
jgi:hypothetical protein